MSEWETFLNQRYGVVRGFFCGWALWNPRVDDEKYTHGTVWDAVRLFPRERRVRAVVRVTTGVEVVRWHRGVPLEAFVDRARIDHEVPKDVVAAIFMAPRIGSLGNCVHVDGDGVLLEGSESGDGAGVLAELAGPVIKDGIGDEVADLKALVWAMFPEECARDVDDREDLTGLPVDALRAWKTVDVLPAKSKAERMTTDTSVNLLHPWRYRAARAPRGFLMRAIFGERTEPAARGPRGERR